MRSDRRSRVADRPWRCQARVLCGVNDAFTALSATAYLGHYPPLPRPELDLRDMTHLVALAPQPSLPGVHVEPDIKAGAPTLRNDPANSALPLRRAGLARVLERIGKAKQRAWNGSHATFSARAMPSAMSSSVSSGAVMA